MKMKRITPLICAVIMAFTFLSACNTDHNNSSENSPNSTISSSQEDKSSSSLSSSENDNSNSKTDDSSKESVESLEDNDSASEPLEFQFTFDNSWDLNGKTCYQYKGIIVNNQSSAISGWSVTIPISNDITVNGSWGISYKIENNKIIVTPEDYSSTINANASIDFGIQLVSSSALETGGITLTAGSQTVNAKDKVKLPSNNTNQPQQQGNSQSNNSSNNNQQQNQGNDQSTPAKEVPEANTDDWLSVKGTKIVDSDGKEVWLTGCNWFGYNTGTNTFDGLWACDLNSALSSIADRGFNLLRIPISTELINQWEDGDIPDANYNNATNYYLNGMNSLEIFDYVVEQCRANGIKIMIDIHCAVTDSMGHMKPLWTDGDITEKDYLRSLSWMADRYKNDDTIIAYDLKNEPHGKQNETPRAKWDSSKDSDNWKYIAEKAADAVLSKNPHALVMVEGIECYPIDIKSNGNFKSTNEDDYYFNWWGGNLRGVADNPLNLGKFQKQLVYSPHDYGPTVYKQPWFEKNFDFDSLMEDCWYDNWFYIYDEDIAPLLIGEWGSKMEDEDDIKWITNLRKLIKDNKLNHTFWCFNANSGDTKGLVLDDFTTWDEEKYEFVKEVLWQKNDKFVSLDHQIPLGENGISLSDY